MALPAPIVTLPVLVRLLVVVNVAPFTTLKVPVLLEREFMLVKFDPGPFSNTVALLVKKFPAELMVRMAPLNTCQVPELSVVPATWDTEPLKARTPAEQKTVPGLLTVALIPELVPPDLSKVPALLIRPAPATLMPPSD